jgi:peptidylprolyl isomerase
VQVTGLRRPVVTLALGLLLVSTAIALAAPGAAPQGQTGPVLVVDTAKGTFEIQTFPEEAPKTVAHILALVKKNFYRGLRFHRVEKNFVVQVGDPQTRDRTKEENWGKGPASGSGTPIGVAEFSKLHVHKRGAVGMAHAGDATQADSQFYIMLRNAPALDGKYTVWGQVISGMDVVEKLSVGDVLKNITVRAGTGN